jgi:hypothetical protein
MKKVYKRGDKDFFDKLKKVAKKFKGKGGGPDAESAVNAHKGDIKEGYVTFWSDNSDITNLLTRSRKYVLAVEDYGETVCIRMDKRGFRSCIHAFKVGK